VLLALIVNWNTPSGLNERTTIKSEDVKISFFLKFFSSFEPPDPGGYRTKASVIELTDIKRIKRNYVFIDNKVTR